MEKWVSAVGVFGYIGLLIGYILAVTYLDPRKRMMFHLLFGGLSVLILAGVVANSMGWVSGGFVVQGVLLSMGVTAFLMMGLFWYFRKKVMLPRKSSPRGTAFVPPSPLPDRALLSEGKEGDLSEGNPEMLPEERYSLETIFREGFSVLLYGPTGSGKTFGVIFEHLRVLEKKGERDGVVLIPCTDGMEDYDLLSKPIPIGPREKVRLLQDLGKEFPSLDQSSISRILGDWTRVEGPLKSGFRRASQGERLAIVFDELNRASRSARNLILKAMDPVLGHYELHDFTSGEILRASLSSIQFCATCNLGASYNQTHDLDESLLDRFQSVLFVDYNPVLEYRILGEEGLSAHQSAQLVQVAVSLRDAYKMGHLAAPLSTRHLKNWARAIVRGGDPIATARSLWVDRLIVHDRHGYPDDEQIRAIMEILSMTFRTVRPDPSSSRLTVPKGHGEAGEGSHVTSA
ncbi:MAG: AAA family ATPase [Leptospirales bacterium]